MRSRIFIRWVCVELHHGVAHELIWRREFFFAESPARIVCQAQTVGALPRITPKWNSSAQALSSQSHRYLPVTPSSPARKLCAWRTAKSHVVAPTSTVRELNPEGERWQSRLRRWRPAGAYPHSWPARGGRRTATVIAGLERLRSQAPHSQLPQRTAPQTRTRGRQAPQKRQRSRLCVAAVQLCRRARQRCQQLCPTSG